MTVKKDEKSLKKICKLSRNAVYNCLLKFKMLKWLKIERTF